MKIAHLSDLHLGGKSPGDPHGAERLNSFRRGLRRLAAEHPDAMVIAGDVFDSPQVDHALIEAAARMLDAALSERGTPAVVIPGNHDPSEASALWKTFQQSLGEQSHVHLVLSPAAVLLAEGKLIVEAYPCETKYSPEPPWIKRVSLSAGAEEAVRVVVAHGTLQGGPVPEGEMEAFPFVGADVDALQADYLALGHFHSFYPPWPGGEETETGFCYCGTHEPDQFNSDSGWAVIATVTKGRPARVRRIPIGHRYWRRVDIGGPLDLARLDELRGEVDRDGDPRRFVIRIKLSAQARLTPEEAGRIESIEEGLRVLGAHFERQGDLQTQMNVEALDLSALPSGAVKQALLAVQQEFSQATEAHRREVLAAALQLGWERMQRNQPL